MDNGYSIPLQLKLSIGGGDHISLFLLIPSRFNVQYIQEDPSTQIQTQMYKGQKSYVHGVCGPKKLEFLKKLRTNFELKEDS